MSDRHDGNNIDLDKDIDVNVDVDFDFDTEIKFDKEVNIDIDAKSDVDPDGNFAQITFDAQAVGEDGVVQVDLVVLTIDNELAMVAGSITSFTD